MARRLADAALAISGLATATASVSQGSEERPKEQEEKAIFAAVGVMDWVSSRAPASIATLRLVEDLMSSEADPGIPQLPTDWLGSISWLRTAAASGHIMGYGSY